jgi:TonB family protein
MTKANCMGLALFVTLACGGNPPDPAEPVPLQPPSEPEPKPMSNQTAVGIEEPEDRTMMPVDKPGMTSEDEAKPPGNTVEETRTTEVIQEVVAKKRDTVRVCFDSLSKEEKGHGGTLTIAFKLDPKGNVRNASLNDERSTLKLPKLVNCAIDAIRAMKFPASSRGFESSVNYPFTFKP